MKLLLRCAMALIAIGACVTLISNPHRIQAQSCCAAQGCSGPPPPCSSPVCLKGSGCYYNWGCYSPIVIDVKGDGFHLTDQADGVLFNFSGDPNAQKKKVAWTDPKFGNAWLALDRNGNGTIDNASELFGNFAPQPASGHPNGFLALAVYDLPENGGNGDGQITTADQIYSQLRLWTDLNQNGISEPDELQTLDQAGVKSIALNYSEGHRVDQFGNHFQYRSHVRMNTPDFDHEIYDVYLIGAN